MGSPIDSHKHNEHDNKEVHSQPNLAQAIWSGLVNECKNDMEAGMQLIPGNRAVKAAVTCLSPLTIFAAGVGTRHGEEVRSALKQDTAKGIAQAAAEAATMAFPHILPLVQLDPRELNSAEKSSAASAAAKAAEAAKAAKPAETAQDHALRSAAAAGMAAGLTGGLLGQEFFRGGATAAAAGVHEAGKAAKTHEIHGSAAKRGHREETPAPAATAPREGIAAPRTAPHDKIAGPARTTPREGIPAPKTAPHDVPAPKGGDREAIPAPANTASRADVPAPEHHKH